MYRVAVKREFSALHYLVGGDWGAENFTHAHHYTVELELAGVELNPHGFLVDIVEIEACLEGLVASYSQQPLNDLPEFAGLNPSVEQFSRIIHLAVCRTISTKNLCQVTVRLWESQIAWAAYQLDL
jgi:6-pyruvoyltetrahydropterin/6-carboxytetrahydropterin synthase